MGPHQMGGIYSINDRIKNDHYTFTLLRDTGPITTPIIRAIEWITTNCDGWTLDPGHLPDDIEMLAAIRGMRHSMGIKKPSYLDENGRLRRTAVDAFELIVGLNVLEDIPTSIDMCYRIEQIMPFAHIRWPSYSVLWDAVHGNKTTYMGSIRSWVIEEIEKLGLGIPTIGQKAPKGERIPRGRPPVVIRPTSWGLKLVLLADTLGEQFKVTDQMRVQSRRVQSAMVPKSSEAINPFKERYLKFDA